MGLKFRQVRRFAIIISFLAITFIVYLATFSTSLPCQDRTDRDCGRKTISKKSANMDDHARNEVEMLIEEGKIFKRSYKDNDGSNLSNLGEKELYRSRVINRRISDDKLNRRAFPEIKSRKDTRPIKNVVTLSHQIRNFNVQSMFIQIKEADSPKIGDFKCSATTVPDCCAFTVGDTNEAKRICEAFGKFCKGFVMSTISSKVDSFEYVMYLKKELNGTRANYLTDFFIKVDHLDELRWNDKSVRNVNLKLKIFGQISDFVGKKLAD